MLFPPSLTLKVESSHLKRDTAPEGKQADWSPADADGAASTPRDAYQYVHVEDPAVLPGADAEGLQVDAALVVKYPVEGVSDLCAKVITSSTFKFRGSIG